MKKQESIKLQNELNDELTESLKKAGFYKNDKKPTSIESKSLSSSKIVERKEEKPVDQDEDDFNEYSVIVENVFAENMETEQD